MGEVQFKVFKEESRTNLLRDRVSLRRKKRSADFFIEKKIKNPFYNIFICFFVKFLIEEQNEMLSKRLKTTDGIWIRNVS